MPIYRTPRPGVGEIHRREAAALRLLDTLEDGVVSFGPAREKGGRAAHEHEDLLDVLIVGHWRGRPAPPPFRGDHPTPPRGDWVDLQGQPYARRASASRAGRAVLAREHSPAHV